MEYDRIILEMLDRIKTLEEKVAALEGSSPSATTEDDSMKVCKEYRRLAEKFESADGNPIRLSFAEIEDIIGFALPESARQHRAYWANTTTHSISSCWMSAGYKVVDVNLTGGYIVFERLNKGDLRILEMEKNKVTTVFGDDRPRRERFDELFNALQSMGYELGRNKYDDIHIKLNGKNIISVYVAKNSYKIYTNRTEWMEKSSYAGDLDEFGYTHYHVPTFAACIDEIQNFCDFIGYRK